MFTAFQTQDISLAKRLLEEGANPNRLLINGVTPFHFAVGASSSFSEDFINLILQHNGDPNVCDSNGLTPLHVAAIWGKAHLLLLLLQNGADIAQQDEEGKTARQYAVENGNSNCLIILNEFDQTFQFSTTQVYPNQSDHRNNNTCPMQISFSNLEKTVIQPQNFSSESGEEISDCSYDSASSHLSVMKENLSENENFSTPKLNAVFNIDESKRRILLQSTKLNINGDSNNDHFSPDEALEVVIPPEVYKLSDNELRSELIRFGFTVGPIAPGRKLYQRRLTLLRQGVNLNDAKTLNLDMLYSQELRCFLIGKPTPPTVYEDDQILRLEFDNPDPSLGLREGNNKDCFNYLLLDPRVTKKLPSRASQLSEVECLNIFCGAVFYVGKGKRSRPYAHFKEAIRSDPLKHPSAKVKHILDIWKCNCGVISLNVFQNVIPSEAYTREAAMIATLGLQHLTNCVRGNCYGSASKWSLSRLRSYGAYLLLSAMRIMLLEGERQIRSTQILNQT
uniref:LEM domain-containing protein n=1 Tax=Ciona savignyi TaxID=51511 RepID=H2Z843_CIOSA